MKKSFRLICCFFLIISFSCFTLAAENEDKYSLEDFEILSEDLNTYQNLILWQEQCHDLAETLRSYDHDDNHYLIQDAKFQWYVYEDLKQNEYQKIKTLLECFEEYPVATYVYCYLTYTLGYSDEVAAGIIGNLMVEVGGRTLNLNHKLYSYGSRYFYGMCQWNKGAYSEIFDKGLREQCDFLANTIEYELDTYGFVYKSNYKYSNFLELNSAKDAALMFAKSYERCASSTYGIRQNCADIAYDYFKGLCE